MEERREAASLAGSVAPFPSTAPTGHILAKPSSPRCPACSGGDRPSHPELQPLCGSSWPPPLRPRVPPIQSGRRARPWQPWDSQAVSSLAPSVVCPARQGNFPLTSPEGTIPAPWHPVLRLYLLSEAPTRGQDKLRLVSQRT